MAVILYSTQTCPYCHMAEEYMKQLGVEVEVKDVGVDEAAAQEMIVKTDQLGVPVIEVGEVIMVGFEREALRQALADAGLVS